MFNKLLFTILAFCIMGVAYPQEKKEPKTEPVPSADAVMKAEKSIKEIFKTEYAKKKASEQLDLAKKMMAQATETNDDSAARYVLLREARDIASRAGDIELSLKAVDELAKYYTIVPLGLKLATLEMAEKATGNIPINKSIFEKSLVCADEAAAGDDYDLAGKFLKVGLAAARKTNVLAHTSLVATRTKDLENLRKEFEKVKQSLDALKTNPDDADANLAVGKYRCFQKGDWATGLLCLVKCADESLKTLAKKDLDAPVEPAARLELGDAWWDLGDKLDSRGQVEARLHALFWYRQTVGDLTGLNKTRVEKRVADIEKIAGARAVSVPVASTWMVLFHSSDPTIWNKDVKKSRNNYAVSLSNAPEKMKYLKLTEVGKNRYVIIELAKDQLNEKVEANGYGWMGTNFFDWGGNHLGIYNIEWMAARGDILIQSPGIFKGYRGWGFGSQHSINKEQGWTWNGEVLPGPTVFEISVKATDLSVEETKRLLKKKK
jgi:tetratricopeptide (TPR) repeat protein